MSRVLFSVLNVMLREGSGSAMLNDMGEFRTVDCHSERYADEALASKLVKLKRSDVMVPIRKCPNLYTDISAVHYGPGRYWQALVTQHYRRVVKRRQTGSGHWVPDGTIELLSLGIGVGKNE
jgi:hypothetical protein